VIEFYLRAKAIQILNSISSNCNSSNSSNNNNSKIYRIKEENKEEVIREILKVSKGNNNNSQASRIRDSQIVSNNREIKIKIHLIKWLVGVQATIKEEDQTSNKLEGTRTNNNKRMGNTRRKEEQTKWITKEKEEHQVVVVEEAVDKDRRIKDKLGICLGSKKLELGTGQANKWCLMINIIYLQVVFSNLLGKTKLTKAQIKPFLSQLVAKENKICNLEECIIRINSQWWDQ
jgi:hypothetical protein